MRSDPGVTGVRTVCSYCGVGCGMVLDVVRDATGARRVTRVAGDRAHPANAGRLCTKGATSADLLAAGGRLATALIRPRRDERAAPAGVDAAISQTARRLRAIIDEHGPDAVCFYVSGQLTLEAQYLANKLAKGFVGTNQIESNSRLCMASAASGYKLSLGADGPPGSYQDFDLADVFLVIGSNMADCHPVLFLRMMDRVKAGARLIVVDPRRTATAEKADLFLQIRPGTDLALLNGLLQLLVAAGRIDEAFIAEFTEGWDAMPELLADYPPYRVSDLTGIPEDDLRTAAQWIGRAGNWMSCWTMGLNQSTRGTWNTNALCNLHLATGAICRPGSGPFSLTGQPNAMGGREMGYLGGGLPGQRSVGVEEDRRFVEDLWGLPAGRLRDDAGGGTVDMFARMADGLIKACWIICTNPVASVGNRDRVIAGLEAAEFVVTQDAFADTETNAYADIVLPAAMWAESDGVMVNSERNLTLLRQAADPPGDALPDWQIIARVAGEMGYRDGFDYATAEEIFDEIRRAWNPMTGYDLRGVSYDRLRRAPVQWPAPPGHEPDRNPVRYRNDGRSQRLTVRPDGAVPRLAFPTATGRAVFFARPHLPPAELPDDRYPFVLNTGRLPHQWHTLTKTGKVARLNRLNPGPFIAIHPADAATLGIGADDPVEVASRRGRAVLPAVLTDRVLPGNCFAPFHWNDLFGEYLSINAVTQDGVDPISYQPELKACAVALTRVATEAAAPAAAGSPAAPAAGSSAVPAAGSPAAPAAGSSAAAAAAAAQVLGVAGIAPPDLTGEQRHYLAGFLAGLAADARTGHGGAVPVLPDRAPLDPAAARWVDGVLGALFSPYAAGPGSPAPGPAASTRAADAAGPTGAAGDLPREREVFVVWASQTGRAEDFAAHAAGRLRDAGTPARLHRMDDYSTRTLPSHTDLILITSTFGDGDAPDNGAGFLESLSAPGAPLHDVRYAVLAFGDSSYADFCGHGRRIDERLDDRGAVRLLPRVECEPHDESRAAQWLEEVAAVLARPPAPSAPSAPSAPPAPPTPSEPPAAPEPPAKTPPATRPPATRPPATRPPATRPPATRPPAGEPPGRPGVLTGNRLLSRPGAAKEVREFTIDLAGTGLAYRAGDTLAVMPDNGQDLVAEWLTVTGTDPAEPVDLPGLGPIAFGEALRRHLELTRPGPELLRFVAERGHDRHLSHMLHAQQRVELDKWLWGRQAVDVVAEYGIRAGAREWAGVLRRLAPRRYSISSSPLADPGEARIMVSVVRFDSPRGRRRNGACSTYLADAPERAPVAVAVHAAHHFRPPDRPDTPMIMIGPGTGLAPFLGFLDDRRARGHQGPNWLFFGEQRLGTDFYHRDKLIGLRDDGFLTRLDVAFSRDQRAKVYVQDRMREQGAQLWEWIDSGAHLYVCGDATRMARDVDRTLREIVARHGGLGDADAAALLRQLATDRRYARDVY